MGFWAVQKWLKAVGKEQGRKGKRLFMPMRIALTVRSLSATFQEIDTHMILLYSTSRASPASRQLMKQYPKDV